MKNTMVTPARMAPGKKKSTHGTKHKPKAPMKMAARTDPMPKEEQPMPDQAFSRNFTKKGVPKLNASTGEGAMGQRR